MIACEAQSMELLYTLKWKWKWNLNYKCISPVNCDKHVLMKMLKQKSQTKTLQRIQIIWTKFLFRIQYKILIILILGINQSRNITLYIIIILA